MNAVVVLSRHVVFLVSCLDDSVLTTSHGQTMAKTEFEFWKIFFVWAFRAPCQPVLEWRRAKACRGGNRQGAGQLCRVVCMSLKCECEPPPAPAAALDSGYNSDLL